MVTAPVPVEISIIHGIKGEIVCEGDSGGEFSHIPHVKIFPFLPRILPASASGDAELRFFHDYIGA
jgi:hypothetical protein